MAINTFITKVVEECDKCRDFIDHNAIKSLRFEYETVPSHQALGPLFNDNILELINEMLKKHCLNLIFQGHDW